MLQDGRVGEATLLLKMAALFETSSDDSCHNIAWGWSVLGSVRGWGNVSLTFVA
jgi:hypothetical protein